MPEQDRHIVAGIDLAAGRGMTEVALLELAGGAACPRYLSHAYRTTTNDEEIVAVLAEACSAVVAIDAPLSLPVAVAAAVRGTPTSIRASDGPHLDAGSDDADFVGAFGERPPAAQATSPYTRAAERDPLWSGVGVRPLPVSFLGGLTFRALVLVPKLRRALPDAAIIEVFPTATLRMLGIRPGEAGVKRVAKSSEAARRATQSGLARYIMGIPAVEDELLGADLLDSLAAALTGVAYSRRAYVTAGDPAEGQIVLPDRAFVHQLGVERTATLRDA